MTIMYQTPNLPESQSSEAMASGAYNAGLGRSPQRRLQGQSPQWGVSPEAESLLYFACAKEAANLSTCCYDTTIY